jgi:adenylate kinase family enzyme
VKIHIIGIPSAGKSTLAKDLSQQLGVPHHPLDHLAFVDEQWTPRCKAERDEMLAEILREPSFITEGGFLGWTDDLLSAADLIIWLDPPLRVLVWRHIRRFARSPLRIPSLLQFQIRSYQRPAGAGPAKDNPDQTRAGIAAALESFRSKVLWVQRGVGVNEVVAFVDRRQQPH